MEVHVTDAATGEPIQNYGVRVIPKPGTTRSQSGRDRRVRQRGEHPDGLVTIEGLRRGVHWMWILPTGGDWVHAGYVEFELTDQGAPRQEVALSRPTTRTLLVEDKEGDAIANTRVELLAPRGKLPISLATFATPLDGSAFTSSPDQAQVIQEGETDTEGRLTLSAHGEHVCALRVLGPGHAPTVLNDIALSRVDDPWVVRVPSGAVITGSIKPVELLAQLRRGAGVENDQDQKRARAQSPGLRLHQADEQRAEHPPGHNTKFDIAADGSYRIDGIPPGDWVMSLVYWRRHGNSHTFRQDQIGSVSSLGEGDRRELDLDLSHLLRSSLSGTVIVDGSPHRGAVQLMAELGVDPSGRQQTDYRLATCDRDGKFEIVAVQGKWRAYVQTGSAWLASDAVTTVGSAGVQDAVFPIHSGHIHLRVVNHDGTPLAGAELLLSRTTDPRPVALNATNANGRIRVHTTAGTYSATINPKRLTEPEGHREFAERHREDPHAWQRARIVLAEVTVPRGTDAEVIELRVPESAGY